MADLVLQNLWEPAIYMLDYQDPVQGYYPGLGNGIDNVQAQQLGNRTVYLKAEIERRGVPFGLAGLDADGHLYLDTENLFKERRIGFKLSANNYCYFSANSYRIGIFSPQGGLFYYQIGTDYVQSDKHFYLDTPGRPNQEGRLGFNEGNGSFSYFYSLPDRVGITTPQGIIIEMGRASQKINTTFQCDWMPVGAVLLWSGNSPPESFLELNGAILNRVDFPRLADFALQSGRMVSEAAWLGDPKNSGYFSSGNGVDTFRLPDFRGYFPRFWDNGRGLDMARSIGYVQDDLFKSHTHNAPTSQSANAGPYAVPHQEYQGYDYVSAAPTSSSGGVETRPKNIAVMAIIRWR